MNACPLGRLKASWAPPVLMVSCFALGSPRSMPAQDLHSGPEVILEEHHDSSAPVREMLQIEPNPGAGARRILPLIHEIEQAHISTNPDPVVQRQVLPRVSTVLRFNFEGIGARDGLAPPDTNASVGSTQVVETVNTSYQVFDKATGTSVLGPAEISSLWTNFGGPCQTGPNHSDPIVLYDKAADRWMISILAFNNTFTANYECIAVSAGSDATMSYNRYAFSFGNKLNDYPKFGVWPDAYYASYNLFPGGGSFAGAAACAYDRTAMLAGATAKAVCFQQGPSDYGMLPSDLDGSIAPAPGEANYFLELSQVSTTTLNLFKFHVDFTTPALSTFTGLTPITIANYSDACGLSGICIPQPGTLQQLDSLGDRLMFRLAYRNFGDHEAVVATHSVKASGSGHAAAALRWYEIRQLDSSPVVFQQGTLGGGKSSTSRWMPSIAMDKVGDIVLGFSQSNHSTLYPGIAYTGRIPTDPPGTMETQKTIMIGTGSQNGGLNRWGDYSSMSIDPSDDCTFWFAQEYMKTTGAFNWNTRLAAVKFPGCR